MTSRRESKTCYLGERAMWGSQLKIIDYLSKQFYIVIEQASPGVTCQRDSGDFRVIHTRFSRWSKTGVWEQVFQQLADDADNEYAMIDSTIVRAHQHSAGAKGRMHLQKPLHWSQQRGIEYQDSCCGGCFRQSSELPPDIRASLRPGWSRPIATHHCSGYSTGR